MKFLKLTELKREKNILQVSHLRKLITNWSLDYQTSLLYEFSV